MIESDRVSAAGGTISMLSDGTFTYTPAGGFTGVDSFRYVISDGNGGRSTGTVTLSVGINGGPTAPEYAISGIVKTDDSARLNWPNPVGSAAVVKYAFLDSLPDYYSQWPESLKASFQSFNLQQREATRGLLASIESFTGLKFVEVASAGDAVITFGSVNSGTYGFAWSPLGSQTGTYDGDVWVNFAVVGSVLEPGTMAYRTLVHEVGHALGLEHAVLPSSEITWQYSVMAGSRYPTLSDDLADEYRLYDVAALQSLYGVNSAHATSYDVYDASMLVDRTYVIWDAAGHDVMDLSASAKAVRIDLTPGSFSTAHSTGQNNIAIAFGALIEDAIGSAWNDFIAGNAAANLIMGGRGNDTLSGGDGRDIFAFGLNWGSDTITDFVRGVDRLDFTASGATPEELSIVSSEGSTMVSFGESRVMLMGVEALTPADCVI
jgi:hypothetical protein